MRIEMIRPSPLRWHKERGQTIPLAVIMIPFLVAFMLLVVEVSERWLEVSMVEDALQQATRSAVQQLDYAAFARNEALLRGGEGDCGPLTLAKARERQVSCLPVIEEADRYLRINLRNVRGLTEPLETVAARVHWTARPAGGSCRYSNGQAVPNQPEPLLCAEVRPTMRGIVGWGQFTPLIIAADRLDPVR
ncbi:MAG: hypothetical protein AB4911_02205 [Oscillochloridaceae bacterium umkhey_bin13]